MKKLLVFAAMLVGCQRAEPSSYVAADAAAPAPPIPSARTHGPIGANYPFPANQIYYDASNATSWSPVPSNVAQGLDQLAARPSGGGLDSGITQLTNDVIADAGGFALVKNITGTPGQLIVNVKPPLIFFDPDAALPITNGAAVEIFQPPVAGIGDAGGNVMSIVSQPGQAGWPNKGGDVWLTAASGGSDGGATVGPTGAIRLFCSNTDEFDVLPTVTGGELVSNAPALVFGSDAGIGTEVLIEQVNYPTTGAGTGLNGTPMFIQAQSGQTTDGGSTDGGDLYLYAGGGSVSGSVHLGDVSNGDKILVKGFDGNVYFPGLSGSGNRCVHAGPQGQFGVTAGDCANPGASYFLSPFTAPPAAGTYSQINFAASSNTTIADDRGTLFFNDNGTSTGTSNRLVVTASPATPWTWTVMLMSDFTLEPTTCTPIAGIVVSSGTLASDTAFYRFAFYVSSGVTHLQLAHFSNSTTVTASDDDVSGDIAIYVPYWMQVHNDGTNLTFRYSTAIPLDGGVLNNLLNNGTFPVATIGTITKLGLVVQSSCATNSAHAGLRVYSWATGP